MTTKDSKPLCPICGLTLGQHPVQSTVANREICSDCDYFIHLGFSNYDEQPHPSFYPVTWVYDRLRSLTGRNYLNNKRLWLDEVVEFLQQNIATSPDSSQDCQEKLKQNLLNTHRDIERVERLLANINRED